MFPHMTHCVDSYTVHVRKGLMIEFKFQNKLIWFLGKGFIIILKETFRTSLSRNHMPWCQWLVLSYNSRCHHLNVLFLKWWPHQHLCQKEMNRAERGWGTEKRENQVEPLKTAKTSLVAENMENCISVHLSAEVVPDYVSIPDWKRKKNP